MIPIFLLSYQGYVEISIFVLFLSLIDLTNESRSPSCCLLAVPMRESKKCVLFQSQYAAYQANESARLQRGYDSLRGNMSGDCLNVVQQIWVRSSHFSNILKISQIRNKSVKSTLQQLQTILQNSSLTIAQQCQQINAVLAGVSTELKLLLGVGMLYRIGEFAH